MLARAPASISHQQTIPCTGAHLNSFLTRRQLTYTRGPSSALPSISVCTAKPSKYSSPQLNTVTCSRQIVHCEKERICFCRHKGLRRMSDTVSESETQPQIDRHCFFSWTYARKRGSMRRSSESGAVAPLHLLPSSILRRPGKTCVNPARAALLAQVFDQGQLQLANANSGLSPIVPVGLVA
ncbi:hypothetical protein LIA77_07578 [Sarocladium implicatum]|nr:hypothetical protein LIA77_07578 [Sarocladium implicatum]